VLFLVELDHVKSGSPATPEAGRAFIEQVIFPTLARADQLVAEKKIVAGGPVTGRVALRLMIDADSPEQVDRIVSSLPIWTQAETRITPLITFAERRDHVQALLEGQKRQQ
jgi:muconolactone delta-isomerase